MVLIIRNHDLRGEYERFLLENPINSYLQSSGSSKKLGVRCLKVWGRNSLSGGAGLPCLVIDLCVTVVGGMVQLP